MSACSNVNLSEINIQKVKSLSSQAIGLDFIGQCSNLSTSNVCVDEDSKGIMPTDQSTEVTPVALQCPMRIRAEQSVQSTGMCPARIHF